MSWKPLDSTLSVFPGSLSIPSAVSIPSVNGKPTYKPLSTAARNATPVCLRGASHSLSDSLTRRRVASGFRFRPCSWVALLRFSGERARGDRWTTPRGPSESAAGTASATRRRWWARTERWTRPRSSGSPPPRGSRDGASPTPSSQSSDPRAAVRTYFSRVTLPCCSSPRSLPSTLLLVQGAATCGVHAGFRADGVVNGFRVSDIQLCPG